MIEIIPNGLAKMGPLTEGIHPDGWVGRVGTYQMLLEADIAEVAVTLWNPDLNARYWQNSVSIDLDNMSKLVSGLALGELQTVRFPVHSRCGDRLLLTIESRVAMSGDELDARERSIKIVSINLTAAAS